MARWPHRAHADTLQMSRGPHGLRTCRADFQVCILGRTLWVRRNEWAASSAGRAPRSQRGGREFEPPAVHQSLFSALSRTRRSLSPKLATNHDLEIRLVPNMEAVIKIPRGLGFATRPR